ncbi:AcrR family transcriptional regulator [Agromyces terreus]|uniref:AcrR family transcriptional regulator n=1 Tax=Agromyces terreus TaxID=424795 RepID=A0A9X2H1C5_9MICO|nr:TetR/AcrR family transcriptional regulator C-terminal domain-containing protein [Agromyces terreus]MCP2371416.1 AcrR family transcriptional regulator [Agromyces terreus]
MAEQTPDPELPRGVALAWGVAANPQRGPKRELSIERIVETAMEIADADGLEAVSMSRVATALGFTTMSLYRYVTSKDDLILLMQEAATDMPAPDESIERGWREGVTAWVHGIRACYELHPWLVDIPVSGAPITPNALMVVDWFLREVRELPLSDGEKMSTLLMFTSYARATGAQERDLARAAAAAGPGEITGERYLGTLTELVTPERFPHLAPLFLGGGYVETGGADPAQTPQTDDDFAFGLHRMLDGIETYVAQHGNGDGDGDGDAAASPPSRASSQAAPALDPPRDPEVREAAKRRREAEKALREAQKREREAIKRARERQR